MAKSSDWMPTSREDILSMAKVWLQELEKKHVLWGVDSDEIAKLKDHITDCDADVTVHVTVHGI